MLSGVTFIADQFMPAGNFALMRRGAVAAIGKMPSLTDHYQSGDTVVVSQDTYEAIQAEFARDVTPRKETTP